MNIKDVGKKYPVLEKALKIVEEDGISNLFPPQETAIKTGVLDGKNVLLCCNTGSGKTLIAELAALKVWNDKRKKTVYVVPLRALAMEKFEDFKKYEPLGLRVALSMGDYDSRDEWLENADVIICTFEKLDSLLRHRAPWMGDVGLAILDEVHEIGSDRGPTLEMVTLWLRRCGVQFLGLSATIGNANEIAKWLGAELVESDFRPVPLYEGTYWNGLIEFQGDRKREVAGGELLLIEDELKAGKQALAFVNTRREAEVLARRVQEICAKYADKKISSSLSKEVLGSLETPTEQCRKLAEYAGNGCAFHHAGLPNKQRKLIEDAFRKGNIKFIAATVTLVAGVNLPAHRIIIRNLRRYDEDWPVSTYKQAVGRAGRIRFDKEGEAVVVCRSESEKEQVVNDYILGKPEAALSHLGSEPVLRMHVLGAIAREKFTRDELKWFFLDSFYAFQFRDNIEFNKTIDSVVEKLIRWGFVHEPLHTTEDKVYLIATPLGKRVSELYIDPATGHFLVSELKGNTEGKKNFGFLQTISQAIENYPTPSIRKEDVEKVQETLEDRMSELLKPAPLPWDPDFEEYAKAAKLACILNDWISERSEEFILETYNLAPGDLYTRVEIAKWLIYATHEISDIIGNKEAKKSLFVLGKRLEDGVNEELLPLVALKGIGRIRGRRLFNSGIKTKHDIQNSVEKAKKIVGDKIISKIVT